MRDEDVLEAARAIRPRLASLVGEDTSGVGARLDAIMSSSDPAPKMADDIISVIAANDRLRAEFLKLFPEEKDIVRSAGYVGGPPGLSAPSAAAVYYCTKCDYRFPIFEVGEQVPPCPNGHGPLKLLRNPR